MRAVGVIPGKKEVTLVEHPAPQLTQDTEVRIRCLEVGICGTDKEISSFVYGTPPPHSDYLILGHESLGEVVEVGEAVRKVKPGDLVVPSVRRPCEHSECLPCRRGRQDFCVTGDFTERGIKMRHGYLTDVYVEAEEYLTQVPAELREIGVLVEPLTVTEKALSQIWHIQKRLPWIKSNDPSQPGQGLNAVVLGAGPVGLLAAMAMRLRGFSVWVYSRSAKPNPKAELIEAAGVTYVSSAQETPRVLAERVGRIDLIYEAAGIGELAFSVLEFLALNGILVLTGIPAPRPAVPFATESVARQLVLKNQIVLGTVNADLRDFQNGVDDLGMLRQRWPNEVRGLITGRYEMDAYRELLSGKSHGIKNVITITR
ncbi:MAG: glucose 1-dehydrogenase [Verrucomicrobiota bacterium]